MNTHDQSPKRTPHHDALLDLAAGDLVAVANGTLTRVHPTESCASQRCWVHHPTTDWPLAGAPVYWSPTTRVAYRVCEHAVLHPDIDAVAYANRGRTNYSGRQVREGDAEWHPACDGCCRD